MARARKNKSRKRKAVSLHQMPMEGDLGAGTPAAEAGTIIEPMLNEDGKNPNNMYRRRKKLQSAYWEKRLQLRQFQAAQAIEDAYAGVQALGSGGDSIGRMIDLQTQVQASPKPDTAIDVQTSRQSQLIRVMAGVPKASRPVIEWLFWHNLPLTSFAQGRAHYDRTAEVKVALDLVANHMGY